MSSGTFAHSPFLVARLSIGEEAEYSQFNRLWNQLSSFEGREPSIFLCSFLIRRSIAHNHATSELRGGNHNCHCCKWMTFAETGTSPGVNSASNLHRSNPFLVATQWMRYQETSFRHLVPMIISTGVVWGMQFVTIWGPALNLFSQGPEAMVAYVILVRYCLIFMSPVSRVYNCFIFISSPTETLLPIKELYSTTVCSESRKLNKALGYDAFLMGWFQVWFEYPSSASKQNSWVWKI